MKQKERELQLPLLKNVGLWLIFNLLLCLTVEMIGTLNGIERLIYLIVHSDVFLMNYIVLLILTSPALFFNKMPFVFNLIAVFLMGVAHASRILLIVRGLPLTWGDFFIAKEGLSIADKYVSPSLIGMMIGLLILGVLLLYYSYKIRLVEYYTKRGMLFLFIMTSINILIISEAHRQNKVSEIVDEKQEVTSSEEGTLYAFITSYKGNKDEIAETYTPQVIDAIREKLSNQPIKDLGNKNPNILFVQVESFIDPYSLKGITYSEDPIPYMRPYLETQWSGLMEVPDVNTARTEFEILTGIRIKDFFEYQVPYTSDVLDGRVIESIAHLLKRKEYSTTAIHNNEGSFYSRDKIYGLLGFKRFIALEDMTGVTYSKNWPKDEVLRTYIQKTLKGTRERDFIYTVTVGTHSSYDTQYNSPSSVIKVGGTASTEAICQVQDYIDRLHETDAMLGKLMHDLRASVEPTVLVVYGDHIPALEALTMDSTYVKNKVPYFVMSNYVLQGNMPKDTTSYRLYTEVLNLLGIQGGTLQAAHNSLAKDGDYFKELDLIAYDMLIGECRINKGKVTYEIQDLQRGAP
ncbi:hypothetical protein CS063_02425 [Sporanaerobium hydrogeniformans]|uniref:Uncharacterized protein n=1 Tax=Sporanaerobium hydrogeniformans TaxID=3072179 RepID=A0AC61DI21_9FIRM|nr:LTA synthase family protein [Sporanaerobium hydrogeniformans]PHV72353.1 hypothetical protein CS063_02425 [Sporanaerobium hydrogeniformans]